MQVSCILVWWTGDRAFECHNRKGGGAGQLPTKIACRAWDLTNFFPIPRVCLGGMLGAGIDSHIISIYYKN